ncbi:vWA domain-containing protein [Coraliomargarita akajimensis]|uniref:von Willebrand factor type A n=1 Tax=Coraliomargarita akajimensis (strain DSM 45221 / IAM 15411 / JCM 23193 / KCTC 12865 / 04OKA010-24) TaxID=583355 RepID=D5EJW5_CORAD|nr:VWA domain-containing protein [Coraliomargarita akajimensis]ADE54714.1 von Willebrand factor type A [Coraliomargarita akajimensis DSM 45221]
MLEFTAPWAFLLLLVPILIRWLVPAHRESRDSLQVPYFQRLVALSGETPRTGASVRQRLTVQALGSLLGWCLLVGALARPEWVGEPVQLEKTARDLMLAVDLSGSMDAADFVDASGEQIDRLSAAKGVLNEFVAGREGDRLGLIVFGNAAYLQAPFTDDHETWLALLDESIVNMAGPSTALGDSIGLAIAHFRQSKTENRVLIVLTDGNDTGSRVPPLDAAEVAKVEGVTIYTVAVGDPTTVGEEALDMETLETVARLTGGDSFVASDLVALRETYQRIDALEPASYDSLSYRPREAMFHVPLAAFAVLYVIAMPTFALVGRRQRRAVHV